MIVLEADNTLPEYDCDVWPTNMTQERAGDLLDIHHDHPFTECTVHLVALLTLCGWHDEARSAHRRRSAQ